MFARLYQGGALKVVQVGPKDCTIEFIGLPGADSRPSRLSHVAFLRGLIGITTKVCVVKAIASQHSDCLKLAISWV
jgi:hypothetical protein